MANIKPLPKASVLSYDTIQKLVQLKLKDLADYVNEVESQDVCADMTFKEKFSMIIDRLYNSRSNETILAKKGGTPKRATSFLRLYVL